MKLKVQIIGSGIAGLASAIRLVQKGHEVNIFKQAGYPGGKISQIRWEKYRWDAGPSLFTLPELIEDLFILSGEEMKTSIRYDKLDIVTRYFYEDGKIINAYGDPQQFANEIESVTGEPSGRVKKHLGKCHLMFDLTRDIFIYNAFNFRETFLSGRFLKVMLQPMKLEPMITMHKANEKSFNSEHVVQLFDRYATYNGSSPFKAPGTLNMISHLEHNLGAYFPEKGMY
ncbi:MAG TPA: FAD-binding protein, partial [Bacteroidaceae bacterium]|nr:FAD-binding protein [Bacteroidaceae bacterium]